MGDKKENFARIGIATKGVVYILIGVLTAMAAFGEGGKKTGSSGVLDFLGGQPFGQVLLVITGIGLLGYVFYRFYQAIKDPRGDGSDFKGIMKRLGYAASAVFYGILSYTAFNTVFGSGGGGGKSRESMIATLLDKPFGQWLVGLVAAIFFGKAIFQFHKAFSGNYKKKLDAAGLDPRAQDIMLKSGKVGYTSRGIVIGIIAFLTLKAAITASSSQAGGTKDALQFLQNEFGTIVLAIVAIGLAAYGVFQFVRSRYSQVEVD